MELNEIINIFYIALLLSMTRNGSTHYYLNTKMEEKKNKKINK